MYTCKGKKISKQITTSGNVLHKNNFWKKSRVALHSTHQTVLKFLAILKYSELLYKTEDEFLILAEECLTFQTVSPCLAQHLRSFLLPHVFLYLFEYFKGALQTAVYAVFRYFCFRPCYFFTGMWIIFDPLDICQFWSCDYNILYDNVLHANIGRGATAKTPFRCYLLDPF